MEASLRYGDIEFTMNAAPSPSPNSTGIASFSIIASGFSCRASLGQNLVSIQKPIRVNSSFRFGRFTHLEASHLHDLAGTMTLITRISDPGFINLFIGCIFNLSHQAIVSFNGAGVQIDLFVKKPERYLFTPFSLLISPTSLMEASLWYGDIEFTMNAARSPSPNSTGIASFSIIASGFSCHATFGRCLLSIQKIRVDPDSSFRFGRSTHLKASHLHDLAGTLTFITGISDPGFINLFKDCIFNLSHQAIVSFNGAGLQIDLFVKKPVRITNEDATGYDKDCSICLSAMKKEDTVLTTPCSHEFHFQCVRPWLNQRNTCPLCRYDRPV